MYKAETLCANISETSSPSWRALLQRKAKIAYTPSSLST